MNKLALSILAERLPVPGLHRRAPAGVHAAVELRVQPGRARPRLRLLDDRDRPGRRVPDLRLPRHVALRRDHAAELRHDERRRSCTGSGGPSMRQTHDLDDLDARRRRLASAWSSAPSGPPATTATGGSCDPRTRRLLMRVLVRLDQRGRRARRDRPARRPRRRHVTRGDRPPLLRLAEWIEGMIEFDMELVRYYREHHGVNTFLRSSEDRRDGRAAQARRTTTASTRSTTTRR